MIGRPNDRGAPPDRRPSLGRVGPFALATLAVTLPLAWSATAGPASRNGAEVTAAQHRGDVLARCIGEAARQLCASQAALPAGQPVDLVGPSRGALRLAVRDEKAPPHFLVPELIDLPPPAC